MWTSPVNPGLKILFVSADPFPFLGQPCCDPRVLGASIVLA